MTVVHTWHKMIIDEKSISTHGGMEVYNRLFIDNFLIIFFHIIFHIISQFFNHVIFQIKDQPKISFFISSF